MSSPFWCFMNRHCKYLFFCFFITTLDSYILSLLWTLVAKLSLSTCRHCYQSNGTSARYTSVLDKTVVGANALFSLITPPVHLPVDRDQFNCRCQWSTPVCGVDCDHYCGQRRWYTVTPPSSPLVPSRDCARYFESADLKGISSDCFTAVRDCEAQCCGRTLKSFVQRIWMSCIWCHLGNAMQYSEGTSGTDVVSLVNPYCAFKLSSVHQPNLTCFERVVLSLWVYCSLQIVRIIWT
jgi:hypothetical protein